MTDWDKQPLGEMPDADIARAVGVDRSTVMRHRTRRGIPPFEVDEDSRTPHQIRFSVSATDYDTLARTGYPNDVARGIVARGAARLRRAK